MPYLRKKKILTPLNSIWSFSSSSLMPRSSTSTSAPHPFQPTKLPCHTICSSPNMICCSTYFYIFVPRLSFKMSFSLYFHGKLLLINTEHKHHLFSKLLVELIILSESGAFTYSYICFLNSPLIPWWQGHLIPLFFFFF